MSKLLIDGSTWKVKWGRERLVVPAPPVCCVTLSLLPTPSAQVLCFTQRVHVITLTWPCRGAGSGPPGSVIRGGAAWLHTRGRA